MRSFIASMARDRASRAFMRASDLMIRGGEQSASCRSSVGDPHDALPADAGL
jgi:hypothetical protein